MTVELERLALACLLPSFPGDVPPAWIMRRLDQGLGGLCLFSYNTSDLERLATLTGELRARRPGLLIGIDEEGGDVTRLETGRGSSYPGNGALGAVDDVELTLRVAAAIGADLAAVGVNLDFAPVADVNVNPANPVIGVRSFGSDPALVARHVAAFVAGLQGQGVAACAKHFPGHGSTEQDSHLELPVVTGEVEDGLEPFRAAVAAGVQSIMTAHVLVPSLDDAPATLSRAVVTGLLRAGLGYDGLVIADALEMKAVSDLVGVERAAVLALAAGVDALLIGHDLGEAAVTAITAAVVGAVEAGELDEGRLGEAAARVARVGAWAAQQGAPAAADGSAGRTAARRALVTEGDLSLDGPALVVELRPAVNIAAGEAGHSVGSVLAERLAGTESFTFDEAGAPDAAALADRTGRAMVVVVRDAHRHPWMRDAAGSVLAADPDAVVVELGLPEWRPDGARGYAATLGGGRASFEALADRLLEPAAAGTPS